MTTAVAARAEALMGTVVTIDVSGPGSDAASERAFGWFRHLEAHCSRFDERSELRQLTARAGEAVRVSAILFEAVRFAVSVAEESGGAFDPTVGIQMERRGFNREHRTGRLVPATVTQDEDVTYRDLALDAARGTITLRRPLLLDLGAVAKGLAIDLAARELEPFGDFALNAGGDLYLGGRNALGEAWSVGIRHPREPGSLIASLRVTDRAVCTSGDYERPAPGKETEHHILDPRTGVSPSAVASATVVAPSAMLADALATAAFVLGPGEGLALLARMGVEGLVVTTDLACHQTAGWAS